MNNKLFWFWWVENGKEQRKGEEAFLQIMLFYFMKIDYICNILNFRGGSKKSCDTKKSIGFSTKCSSKCWIPARAETDWFSDFENESIL